LLKTDRSDTIVSMNFGWKWNQSQLSDGGHRQSDVECGVHVKRITYCLRVETGSNTVKMRVRDGQTFTHLLIVETISKQVSSKLCQGIV
jgi:hypothetical protein